ncbi:MAG: hypothetical protein R2759_16960 [Bacteroidales bacterium]
MMRKLGIGLLILFLAFGCAKNNATHSFKDGNAQYQLKNYQGAIQHFSRAIELKNNYKEAFYFRALCYVQKQVLDSALMDFNEAINLDPNYKEAYFSRAFYVKDKLGDYKGSIDDYNHYISLNEGNNAYALNNRGFAKYKQNDTQGALTDIETSLQQDPQNAYAYKNLALVWISVDSLNDACQNLHLALDHGYAQKYDDEVDQLIEEYCKN